MTLHAEQGQVLAFRLAGHHLAARLPAGSLLAAAAACGLQDSPPGSAALALAARVCDLAPEQLDHVLASDKALLQVRGPRAAPYLVPTNDVRVFTLGLLPTDEASLRIFILGAGPALDKLGLSGGELVERTATAMHSALDGRTVPFRQLSSEVTERLASALSAAERAVWRSPGQFGPGQCLGEALVHFAFYVVALQGLWCFVKRASNEATYARTDQWLGTSLPAAEPNSACRELVRRYLRCYGPSTSEHFAAWAGISPVQAAQTWRLVEPELVELDLAGRRTWLHTSDQQDFASPPSAVGVRLLPPHDPYLGQVDRETLLPDKHAQRHLWRPVGNPGVVLAAGQAVGLWRPRKQGRRLAVTVEPFLPLGKPLREEIAEEVRLIAPLRGCLAADATFGSDIA